MLFALIHWLRFPSGGHAAPAYARLGRSKDQWGLFSDLQRARKNAACCVLTCAHTLKINACVFRISGAWLVLATYGRT